MVKDETSEYGFYPVSESAQNVVKKGGYDLRCIDEPFEVKGDFNTNTAANLMVTFELCDSSKRTCKPWSVIEEAL